MCKKNVRRLSCRCPFPVAGTWTVCHLLGLCRAASLWVKLGQTLLYICQRAEDPAHGDLRPQIGREACEWPKNASNTWLFSPSQKNPVQIKHIIVAFHLFQGETESVTLKSCVRKTTDMLDRRFCLDLDITDRYISTPHGSSFTLPQTQ